MLPRYLAVLNWAANIEMKCVAILRREVSFQQLPRHPTLEKFLEFYNNFAAERRKMFMNFQRFLRLPNTVGADAEPIELMILYEYLHLRLMHDDERSAFMPRTDPFLFCCASDFAGGSAIDFVKFMNNASLKAELQQYPLFKQELDDIATVGVLCRHIDDAKAQWLSHRLYSKLLGIIQRNNDNEQQLTFPRRLLIDYDKFIENADLPKVSAALKRLLSTAPDTVTSPPVAEVRRGLLRG
jgi:hypothetical protein